MAAPVSGRACWCARILRAPLPLHSGPQSLPVRLPARPPACQIRTNIVGDEQSKPLTIVVPQRGMWGTAGINGLNIDK